VILEEILGKIRPDKTKEYFEVLPKSRKSFDRRGIGRIE
jgi:hypothetical protein